MHDQNFNTSIPLENPKRKTCLYILNETKPNEGEKSNPNAIDGGNKSKVTKGKICQKTKLG